MNSATNNFFLPSHVSLLTSFNEETQKITVRKLVTKSKLIDMIRFFRNKLELLR